MMPLSLQIISSARASSDNARYFRSYPFRVIVLPSDIFRLVKGCRVFGFRGRGYGYSLQWDYIGSFGGVR